MPATLHDRQRLAQITLFRERIKGACLKVANDVGLETAAEPSDRARRRIDLVNELLQQPDTIATRFAHAAAGWNPTSPATDIADTFAEATGTDDQKVAAITDATLQSYVAGAWNVVAGVMPWERA